MIRRPAPSRRLAFTLIEMSMSLVIFAIVLLASSSAILLAARGIPDGRARSSAMLLAARPLDMISSDLTFATSITSATATDLIFTVPDRTGDGVAETIHYSWSGTAGASLTRQVNSGAAAPIATGVQEFSFVYDKRSAAAPTTYSQGSEILFASYDPGLLTLGSYNVQSSGSVGQYFMPTLPSSATSWSVTRVLIKTRSSGTAVGMSSIQLRPAIGNLPSAAVIESKPMDESTIGSSYLYQQFAFTNTTNLDPTKGLCIVVQWVSGSVSADVQYTLLGSVLGSASSFSGTDSGGWNTALLSAMSFSVYGTVTSPNPTTYNYFLTDVRCTLRTTTDPTSRLVTTIRVPSEPQVAGP